MSLLLRRAAVPGVALGVLAAVVVTKELPAASAPRPPAPRPATSAGTLRPAPAVQALPAATASNALVAAFHARFFGSPSPGAPAITGIAAAPGGTGYYVLRANGAVAAFGAPGHGSVPAPLPPGATATGIAVDARTGGYWVLASDGRIFAFDAPFYGAPHIPPGGWGQYPAAVAIAAAASGRGYYVLRANGAVDNFGVPSYGSLGGHLHYGTTAPVTATGLAVDPATGGYWEVTSVGNVDGFHAPWVGSPLAADHGWYAGTPAVGIVAAGSGPGYYVLEADGAVEAFSAPARGSLAGRLPVGATAAGLAIDPATGGYWLAVDFASVGGYLNPLRGLTSLVPQEIDQGVDYCGFGPVYALGAGIVLDTTSSGWPGGAFISYRLTAGPARGLIAYVAENLSPSVAVGQAVGPTTVLGVLHDAGTCLETGWASASRLDRAAARAEYNGANSTAFGLNFSTLLEQLGAEPGLPQNDGPPGPLPPGWPRW